MFIAMNRFQVAPGRGDEFETAWRDRKSYLNDVPGFLSFKLLKGKDGAFVSHSEWADEAAFTAWTESEAFKKAHGKRLPEGVLMGPPQISCFDVVISENGGG